jgi:predicted N-formylglutamate amidohydrolase
MNHATDSRDDPVARVVNADGAAAIVLVCEHASHAIPAHLNDLGMTGPALTSHAAWDPGAAPVAQAMADRLDAPLVMSCISRLVYDCNRPPEAPDAMPARSEIFDVPGNADLDDVARQERTRTYYTPVRDLLARTLAAKPGAAVVTVHSFTPVYRGQRRAVEIGVLHDSDSRLADAMLRTAGDFSAHDVRRNAPYGPQDGVTHTLKLHALPEGRRNVMLEIRNDLVRTAAEQQAMAAMLADWVGAALARSEVAA